MDELLSLVALEEIADAWCRYQNRFHIDGVEDEDRDLWAVELLMDHSFWSEESRVRAILDLLIDRAPDDDVLGIVAADPLEDFVKSADEAQLRWIERSTDHARSWEHPTFDCKESTYIGDDGHVRICNNGAAERPSTRGRRALGRAPATGCANGASVVGAGSPLAEDAAQEALLELSRSLPRLNSIEAAPAFAMRVATRVAIRMAKRERRFHCSGCGCAGLGLRSRCPAIFLSTSSSSRMHSTPFRPTARDGRSPTLRRSERARDRLRARMLDRNREASTSRRP